MSNINLPTNAIIGGGDQSKRRELDFYPTPAECTKALLLFLQEKKIVFNSVWEPACGDGAISEILIMNGFDVISTELRIESGYGLGGVDFLGDCFYNADAIITNPPFNIADKFIKKSVNTLGITAMLLKSQYWHAKSRKLLFDTHKPAFILPLTWRPDFSGQGGASTMDVAWTVWINGSDYCDYQPLSKPIISKQNQLF